MMPVRNHWSLATDRSHISCLAVLVWDMDSLHSWLLSHMFFDLEIDPVYLGDRRGISSIMVRTLIKLLKLSLSPGAPCSPQYYIQCRNPYNYQPRHIKGPCICARLSRSCLWLPSFRSVAAVPTTSRITIKYLPVHTWDNCGAWCRSSNDLPIPEELCGNGSWPYKAFYHHFSWDGS